MNRAPRMATVVVAVVLVIVGVAGTFGGMLPSLAGMSSPELGAWAYVAAAVLLVLGMIFEGI